MHSTTRNDMNKTWRAVLFFSLLMHYEGFNNGMLALHTSGGVKANFNKFGVLKTENQDLNSGVF